MTKEAIKRDIIVKLVFEMLDLIHPDSPELSLYWKKEFGFDEFTEESNKKKEKRTGAIRSEVDSVWNQEGVQTKGPTIDALVSLVIFSSYKLKMSRYSVIEAIKNSIEANY